MRIDFDDEEYPELSRYLSDPKRKMKFFYFLEELFTQNNFDPILDGLTLIQERNTRDRYNTGETKDDSQLYDLLTGITSAISDLSKNMEGSVIGRFPTEHVVHEVVKEAPKSKTVEMDETDYSSTEGIDFGPSIAMFED